MSGERHRVLHIGGTAVDAQLILDALTASQNEQYQVDSAPTLADGLARLAENPPQALLLHLELPDTSGMQGLETLIRAASAIPILVLGRDECDATRRQVIHIGARDYLLTDRVDSYWLPRALRHAIDRKLSDDALFAETELFQVTLNSMGDGLISTNPRGTIVYLNRAAETMTGWLRAEAAGRQLEDVLHIVDGLTREPATPLSPLSVSTIHLAHLPNDVLIRRDGREMAVEQVASPTRDRLGIATGTAIILRDGSESRAISTRMAHLASHDLLTDLPNRLLMSDRLTRALALAQRHHRRLAVLFLDVDHFKDINDSLGHMVGDELLRAIGREITKCVRSSDTVGRHGGDEFVVILSELEHAEDAAKGAQKIIAALAQPRRLAGHEIHVTVSIGISVYPEDGASPETLLTKADMALYHAKDQGRDGYRFFESDLNVRAFERESIEASLRQALVRQEFELLFQPTLNLHTGAVVGAEALLRWRHPDRGLIAPAEFIAIAESCGLMKPIGRWVLHEACRQAQAWQGAGLPAIPMAVNVSAGEFRDPAYLNHITDVLRETGLAARYLEIEVTERVLMMETQTSAAVLQGLTSMDVHLTVDDFGTGSVTANQLRPYTIDALKIDRSLIREIVSPDRHSAPFVSAMVAMSKSLTHRVIAEGIETRDQLTFLRAAHCDEGQGYYFGGPVSAHAFGRLLERGTCELAHARPLSAYEVVVTPKDLAAIDAAAKAQARKAERTRRQPIPTANQL